MTREKLREKYLNNFALNGEYAKKFNACVAPIEPLRKDIKQMYSVIDSRFMWHDLGKFFCKFGIIALSGCAVAAGAAHFVGDPLYDEIFSELLMFSIPYCTATSAIGAVGKYFVDKLNESKFSGIKDYIGKVYDLKVKTQAECRDAFGEAIDVVGESMRTASDYVDPVKLIDDPNYGRFPDLESFNDYGDFEQF